MYQNWGRRLIYASDNKITMYPGRGKITQPFFNQVFVIPKINGRPFFDKVENKSLYPEGPEQYTVFDIETQDRLIYTVGIFEGWENIDNSLDKYVLVKYPASAEIERYRVAFEDSNLFKDNMTSLAVENVKFRVNSKTQNPLEKTSDPSLVNLTYGVVNELIKKGDALILIPVFDPPELSKTDSSQNLLVSWLILRRVGGRKILEKEIE